MSGPMGIIRSNSIREYENLGPIHEWIEGKSCLVMDRVTFRGAKGCIACYHNPPVHQVGNAALDAYLEGLERVLEEKSDLEFLILSGANDPVHAGGDLKESLTKLDRTLETKRKMEVEGASAEETDRLFDWADKRLRKGFELYTRLRKVAEDMRVVALCGGGTRFGGSAEIPLMADYLVGDSRSGMCFSEAMIGLIPGWSGIGRTLTKAGLVNARYMGLTSREVKAQRLRDIGIYNVVVDVPFSFPKRQRTENPAEDKARYVEDLERHHEQTAMILFPEALHLATRPYEDPVQAASEQRFVLAQQEEITREVERRSVPDNYRHLWGRPLKEARDDISKLGRPLAPQSIEALERLFEGYDPANFEEARFVEQEMLADARLYRDPRFRAGLAATLEQRVADFRFEKGVE